MEAPNLYAKVDMTRLVNDAFVMAVQIATNAQHIPSMNDEPIILNGPNVGGHLEQAIDANLVDTCSNMSRIGEGIKQEDVAIMFNDHDENVLVRLSLKRHQEFLYMKTLNYQTCAQHY
jgi:hypothetical protein